MLLLLAAAAAAAAASFAGARGISRAVVYYSIVYSCAGTIANRGRSCSRGSVVDVRIMVSDGINSFALPCPTLEAVRAARRRRQAILFRHQAPAF